MGFSVWSRMFSLYLPWFPYNPSCSHSPKTPNAPWIWLPLYVIPVMNWQPVHSASSSSNSWNMIGTHPSPPTWPCILYVQSIIVKLRFILSRLLFIRKSLPDDALPLLGSCSNHRLHLYIFYAHIKEHEKEGTREACSLRGVFPNPHPPEVYEALLIRYQPRFSQKFSETTKQTKH